ncbi:MAG: hypothetical protein PHW93_01270 [Candidatus Methanomethylophilaceae archaeon]|nr:hypothetical protein [Candidatus Methanomethylophilaceae archaeon]
MLMDAKKKMENILEDITAQILGGGDYDEVYVVSNSGILLTQEPPNFDSGLPLKLATMVVAMDGLGPLKVARIRFHGENDVYISRLNDRAFIAVRMKKDLDESSVVEKLEKVSIAVKENLPWLR